jgi:hypothetical protein
MTTEIVTGVAGTTWTTVLMFSIVRNKRKRKQADVCLLGLCVGCWTWSMASMFVETAQNSNIRCQNLAAVLFAAMVGQFVSMCIISIKNVFYVCHKLFSFRLAWRCFMLGTLLSMLMSLSLGLLLNPVLTTTGSFHCFYATTDPLVQYGLVPIIVLTIIGVLVSSVVVGYVLESNIFPGHPRRAQTVELRNTLHRRSMVFIGLFTTSWTPLCFVLANKLDPSWLLLTGNVHSILVPVAYGWHNESLHKFLARSAVCRRWCLTKYVLRLRASGHLTATRSFGAAAVAAVEVHRPRLPDMGVSASVVSSLTVDPGEVPQPPTAAVVIENKISIEECDAGPIATEAWVPNVPSPTLVHKDTLLREEEEDTRVISISTSTLHPPPFARSHSPVPRASAALVSVYQGRLCPQPSAPTPSPFVLPSSASIPGSCN